MSLRSPVRLSSPPSAAGLSCFGSRLSALGDASPGSSSPSRSLACAGLAALVPHFTRLDSLPLPRSSAILESKPSVKGTMDIRIAEMLPATGSFEVGSPPSSRSRCKADPPLLLPGFNAPDSSLLLQQLSCLDALVPVLGMCCIGLLLPPYQTADFGFVLLAFGGVDSGSTLFAMGGAALGTFLPIRSFSQLSSSLLVFGAARSGFTVPPRTFAHSAFSAFVCGLAWPGILLPASGSAHLDFPALPRSPGCLGLAVPAPSFVPPEVFPALQSLSRMGPAALLLRVAEADFFLLSRNSAYLALIASTCGICASGAPALASGTAHTGLAPSPRSLARVGLSVPALSFGALGSSLLLKSHS